MLPKTVNIDGKALKLQIWDTAGQDHFKNIAANSFRGAKGIIVCYAINDKKSFNKAVDWLKQIRSEVGSNACLMLIATKTDLVDEREISEEDGRLLAKRFEIDFFETSSKENINVEESMMWIARKIKSQLDESKDEVETMGGSKIKSEANDNGDCLSDARKCVVF